MRRVILAIFFLVVYALPGLAQPRNALTLNDISDLIKNGVRPNRIAQTRGRTRSRVRIG